MTETPETFLLLILSDLTTILDGGQWTGGATQLDVTGSTQSLIPCRSKSNSEQRATGDYLFKDIQLLTLGGTLQTPL